MNKYIHKIKTKRADDVTKPTVAKLLNKAISLPEPYNLCLAQLVNSPGLQAHNLFSAYIFFERYLIKKLFET
jgi:hypothetical protein